MAAGKFLNSLRRHSYDNNIKVYFIVVKSLFFSSENGGGKCIPSINIIANIKRAIILGQPEQKWAISPSVHYLKNCNISAKSKPYLNIF